MKMNNKISERINKLNKEIDIAEGHLKDNLGKLDITDGLHYLPDLFTKFTSSGVGSRSGSNMNTELIPSLFSSNGGIFSKYKSYWWLIKKIMSIIK